MERKGTQPEMAVEEMRLVAGEEVMAGSVLEFSGAQCTLEGGENKSAVLTPLLSVAKQRQ